MLRIHNKSFELKAMKAYRRLCLFIFDQWKVFSVNVWLLTQSVDCLLKMHHNYTLIQLYN